MSLLKTPAIAAALRALPEALTVFTTGYTSRIGASLGERANHFYMTGSMGMAACVGIGIALATQRTTMVLDGDGSVLMNPGGLISAAGAKNIGLIHVVLDDGCYDSTGGQASPAPKVDLVGWARSAGFSSVHVVGTAEELTRVLRRVGDRPAAPVFVRCMVRPDSTPPPPRITDDLPSVARRFTQHAGRPDAFHIGHRLTAIADRSKL
ncbi:thiamine pyrophosphate-dependent enzyme [Streptomyces sp. NPDC057092]|uniref:thiamine pyrophosphate-dependent enzyme n=1 Tax=Streptomyces sp. NPDC057092 TaxID=3346017 RepID=UPI003626F017